jgi:glucose/arabinose dehydrogenase
MHVVKNVGWGEATPKAAPGLKVTAFARNLKNPRSVYVLPNGDVLVVESDGPPGPVNRPKEFIMNWIEQQAHSSVKAGNRILLLRDTNGDGMPDITTVFLDHLNSPFGVVLVGNDLYVANTDGVMHYPYQAGQTQITAPGNLLTPLPGGPIDHHWTKSLTASPDGSKLYAGVGSNSNITENGIGAELDRAAIWEIDRATGAHRLYATGLRNPNGLTFEPQTHKLWAVVNERDELGPDLVPDYMTSVKDGAFYGWPYSYYGQHVDPRVMPQRPDLVAKAIPPDYALSSHVAPLGLVFYTGNSLPAIYNGGAFIGEHGSWDRTELNGYKVVFVPFSNGVPSGTTQDILTGFVEGETAHGRPVALALDSHGALLVADDVGGAVWRVTAAGK